MNPFRVLSWWFALSLATATLVMPVAMQAGFGVDSPFVNGGVSLAAAVALLGTKAGTVLDGETVWSVSALTFAFSVAVHLAAGTGANSGDASPVVVVAVWLASVAVAAAVVFRDRLTKAAT